jgi:hypothetical protein
MRLHKKTRIKWHDIIWHAKLDIGRNNTTTGRNVK